MQTLRRFQARPQMDLEIQPTSMPNRPRIGPRSTPIRTQMTPSPTPNSTQCHPPVTPTCNPKLPHTILTHRPRSPPKPSTPRRSQIDAPDSTPDRPQNRTYTPNRPQTNLNPALGRPQTGPESRPDRPKIDPRSTHGRPHAHLKPTPQINLRSTPHRPQTSDRPRIDFKPTLGQPQGQDRTQSHPISITDRPKIGGRAVNSSLGRDSNAERRSSVGLFRSNAAKRPKASWGATSALPGMGGSASPLCCCATQHRPDGRATSRRPGHCGLRCDLAGVTLLCGALGARGASPACSIDSSQLNPFQSLRNLRAEVTAVNLDMGYVCLDCNRRSARPQSWRRGWAVQAATCAIKVRKEPIRSGKAHIARLPRNCI